MEEGLPGLHALTFGDVDLGDEARYLGTNLGIVLASDDGGIAVISGEVACGEGAYGEFLGALGLSLLGRLAGAGGQERDPCSEEQEAKARDGEASMRHDSCGVVLLVCLLMKSAPRMGAVERDFPPLRHRQKSGGNGAGRILLLQRYSNSQLAASAVWLFPGL